MAQTKNINPSKTEIQKPFSQNTETKSNFEQQKKITTFKKQTTKIQKPIQDQQKFLKN